ncbi:pilus assembly protein [Methylomarinovum caldicuralii]|nr:PilC/PilY family type IV pilus protein [Methylomarinovum caldicuralii]
MATTPDKLVGGLGKAFNNILAKTGSAASAATNSTSLVSGSVVYQARFNSGDWSGQLLSLDIDLAGTVSSTPNWDAGDVIDTQTPASRTILTISRDSHDGIPFTWSAIAGLSDTTQKDYLNKNASGAPDGQGSDRVDFLRGSDVSGFRVRSSKLGDIVHSRPFYVGPPKAGFLDSSYASFASTYASRTPIVYVGANDGMLHGFDAATGEEKIAYVPGPVYKNLSRLTDSNYGQSSVPHRYFVDGSPMVADAKFSSGWKTVLAGGLNGGGQGYYALDVTDPANFSEANAASLVLWEFTDEDDADLGYTYNQPPLNFLTRQSAQIAKMNNGKWALIVGNGYNNSEADGHASTTGHAVLFVLFLEGGTDGDWTDSGDYVKIDTGVGSTATPNGLATPMPVDTDGDGDIDIAYAGDLEGNLWKFDLTDTDPANWTTRKLFTAKDASNNPQPITTAPMVVPHPNGGYMVGFGTGKYLEHADLTDTSPQTLYGIWDDQPGGGVTAVSGRSKLVEQTVLTVKTISGQDLRLTSNNSAAYSRNSSGAVSSSSDRGWFMDLPDSGERVAYNPIARDQRFVFVTLVPDSSDPCAAGGYGWLMELDYLDGSELPIPPFDFTGDDKIDDSDKVAYDRDGDGANELIPPTGKKMAAIPTTPAPIDKDAGTEVKLISQSSGNVASVLESKAPGTSGRLSWRQVIGD